MPSGIRRVTGGQKGRKRGTRRQAAQELIDKQTTRHKPTVIRVMPDPTTLKGAQKLQEMIKHLPAYWIHRILALDMAKPEHLAVARPVNMPDPGHVAPVSKGVSPEIMQKVINILQEHDYLVAPQMWHEPKTDEKQRARQRKYYWETYRPIQIEKRKKVKPKRHKPYVMTPEHTKYTNARRRAKYANTPSLARRRFKYSLTRRRKDKIITRVMRPKVGELAITTPLDIIMRERSRRNRERVTTRRRWEYVFTGNRHKIQDRGMFITQLNNPRRVA